MNCIAHRRAAQDASVTKWQPKKTVGEEDGRQTLAIMIELLQGYKAIDHDFETTIEEPKK